MWKPHTDIAAATAPGEGPPSQRIHLILLNTMHNFISLFHDNSLKIVTTL